MITRDENVVPTEPIKASQMEIEVDQPAEKETSKPEWKTSSPARSTLPVKRVVENGDTLYSLIREVYGSINNDLIAQVKIKIDESKVMIRSRPEKY